MTKRNLISVGVSVGFGIILFFPAVYLSAELAKTSSHFKVLDFYPLFLVFILATFISWWISKNWVVTAIVFGFFVLVSYILFGGPLDPDMPNLTG